MCPVLAVGGCRGGCCEKRSGVAPHQMGGRARKETVKSRLGRGGAGRCFLVLSLFHQPTLLLIGKKLHYFSPS